MQVRRLRRGELRAHVVHVCPGESLTSLVLRDSGYGHGSVRRIELTTSKGGRFAAGPDGFDHELNIAASGAYLLGAFGVLNPDNFVAGLGFWISKPTYYGLLPTIDAVVKSDAVGNMAAGRTPFDIHSGQSPVRYIGVRSDGDKVRGIQWQTFDGAQSTFGDYNATQYALTSHEFDPDEQLQTFTLRSSGYGYGSVSRVEFTTSKGVNVAAGSAGFDHEIAPPVQGGYLLGFHGAVNADNFLNALGIWTSLPKILTPPLNAPLQTAAAGNAQAGATRFDEHSTTSPIHYFGVRWDGDKVRGVFWQCFDGVTRKFGDYDASAYTLTSYTFAAGESLTALSIKDSAYGHGSVRRIEFTTSTGGSFAAGPGGFDHETNVAAYGSFLLGFYGALNADNFLNSLGCWISAPSYSVPAMAAVSSTPDAGNPAAGATAFSDHSDTAPVRYLGVRSDGDKLRGVSWEYFDGRTVKFGDVDAVDYTLTSYAFDPGESLATLSIKDSAYGHGSVRRIELTTSQGGGFSAGPDGFDHETGFSVYGSYLAGLHGRINADNFISSLGLWISKPDTPQIAVGEPRSTGEAGNPQAGSTPFNQHSATSPVRYLGVRWDGDKVRGLSWTCFDGTTQTFGDYDAVGYTLTSYTFEPDERLASLSVKDSGYGHGSVRHVELTTSRGGRFAAGPDGFDHETSFFVTGSQLLGFLGTINADNFLNSLGLWISPPVAPSIAIGSPRQDDLIGNPAAGNAPFDAHSATSSVRYLGVRSDGDKVRGIAWELFDGTKQTFGDYDAVDYALSSYTFAPDEFLTALTLKDSGYGHGSVRRLELRTSKGGVFAAGPDGFDRAVNLQAYGTALVGFRGSVNTDNFLNALGPYLSAPMTMNGWDYVLAVSQPVLNTLMPLLSQINPKVPTAWGAIQIQRAWIATQPNAAAQGLITLGLQVTGILKLGDQSVPLGEDTIWRILVTLQLASFRLRLVPNGSKLDIKIELLDKAAFNSVSVEFAPANAAWAQLIAPSIKQALDALAPGSLHIGDVAAPALPAFFSGVTEWMPTDVEFIWTGAPTTDGRGGLALAVSTAETPPSASSRRAFDVATLRAGPELAVYCSNDRLIRLLGQAMTSALRSTMGAQDRYPENHPFEFTYRPVADGSRTYAFTDGNYCNFWDIKFTPSVDWCWIDAFNDRINVELRLRTVPFMDTAAYVNLDAAMTLTLDDARKLLVPHLSVNVSSEIHVGTGTSVTAAAVTLALAEVLGPLIGAVVGAVEGALVGLAPSIVDDIVGKVANNQVGKADVSNRAAVDLRAMPLFDMTFNAVNFSGTGDLALGVHIKPWPMPPAN